MIPLLLVVLVLLVKEWGADRMKSYNVRVVVLDNGNCRLDWVHGFIPNKRTPKNPKGEGGSWGERSVKRMAATLNRCARITT